MTRDSGCQQGALAAALLEGLRKELYCELRPSTRHGIGVFAIRSIPKGIDPLVSRLKFRELRLSHSAVKTLPKAVQKALKMFCYFDEAGFLVPSTGLNVVDMAVYLNHDKEPNLRMQSDGSFLSLLSIRKGEELTMDYDHSFGAVHSF
ncbi:MAG: SET domain-containing protein [Betaproteobacteria bacterium]|jgi:SET domain-containing protein|nr:SET domain-containing protein [Betaproteobacteria bacterium]NBO43544.1 SET domain-containing protein [Betaproteobacteria bacterium]NBP10548.1 SET domain-containing protein [Betaproteobacteria bacterium]NBP61686.1 SET domain-containing protein [Betaproteobacteria bacterium]NBQ08668.1 SET domain-containing protein [Betaproteobacteria bacterium]